MRYKGVTRFKEVRLWLYNYPSMLIAVDNLKMLYSRMAAETVGAVVTDSVGSGVTNKVTSTTENMALTLQDISERQIDLECKISMLKSSLAALTDTQYDVINCKYFKGMKWDEMSDEMKYDKSYLWRIEVQALNKLELMLFGKFPEHTEHTA